MEVGLTCALDDPCRRALLLVRHAGRRWREVWALRKDGLTPAIASRSTTASWRCTSARTVPRPAPGPTSRLRPSWPNWTACPTTRCWRRAHLHQDLAAAKHRRHDLGRGLPVRARGRPGAGRAEQPGRVPACAPGQTADIPVAFVAPGAGPIHQRLVSGRPAGQAFRRGALHAVPGGGARRRCPARGGLCTTRAAGAAGSVAAGSCGTRHDLPDLLAARVGGCRQP